MRGKSRQTYPTTKQRRILTELLAEREVTDANRDTLRNLMRPPIRNKDVFRAITFLQKLPLKDPS